MAADVSVRDLIDGDAADVAGLAALMRCMAAILLECPLSWSETGERCKKEEGGKRKERLELRRSKDLRCVLAQAEQFFKWSDILRQGV